MRPAISSTYRPMKAWRALASHMDRIITGWMADNAISSIRVSLGIVFLWFGALKFFPGLSVAETLAGRTIEVLTFGRVPPQVSLPVLAILESLIGMGLLIKVAPRLILFLLFVQMLGTLTPLFLFPDETFHIFPFAPTLEGQYIIKNLVLISAAIAIGATVRGGRIVAEPGRKRR